MKVIFLATLAIFCVVSIKAEDGKFCLCSDSKTGTYKECTDENANVKCSYNAAAVAGVVKGTVTCADSTCSSNCQDVVTGTKKTSGSTSVVASLLTILSA